MAAKAKAKRNTSPRPKVGGKARRKSTDPIPLPPAPELAAKRLGIADLDYAKAQLRGQLKTATPGHDWGWQAMDPPGALDNEIATLWDDNSLAALAWTIDWERGRASMATISYGVATVYGLWIAPRIIARLASRARRGKSTGRPPTYDGPWLQGRREVMKECGPSLASLEGEGGLIEQVEARVPETKMPGRSQAREILLSVWNEFKAPR